MPGSIRLFLPAPLAAGAALPLGPGQAHYLGTVMRRAVGERVRVFNGADGEWEARIASLARGAALLEAERCLRPQAPEPDLWLAFAPLRREATEFLVQKATELGAAALRPVYTGRTNPGRLNEARLAAIAIEAAEQCERLTVPRLAPPVRLTALLAEWPPARPLFVALERAAAPMLRPCAGPAGLMVGPEGGFAPAELDEMGRHAFVMPASLGPRVLRAETAAIVGLALLQAPCGG
jgi:16S rRNA (uracil1498-N3)-methyltransferase